ncbi:MAG: portal protein [Alphaproteobacteria bacterium]
MSDLQGARLRHDVTEIIARADRLRSDRGTFEAHWQEIRDHIIPMAAAITRAETPGAKSHQLVFDNSGESAHEMLAGALVGIMTPDTADWFTLRAMDERVNRDRDAAVWLEDCAARMLSVFRSPKGGFGTAQHEKYLDVSSFGTGAMFIADRPGAGIRFTSVPLSQVLLAEDADGAVDTVFRDFTLTARLAVDRFGRDAGPKIQAAAAKEREQDKPFRFIHAVHPRTERDGSRGGRRNMAFASIYVSVEDRTLMAEGGFHEMPYVTPRWLKRGDEVYGRGPGMKALADVKMLQRAMKVTIKGVEKIIDPPLLVADDGVLSPVRVTPSGINYYRAGTWSMDPIKPLMTGGRPDLGEEFMAGIRVRIEAAFFKPLIQMIRKDRMTATEVLQVAEEGQRILGPYLGRLKAEDVGPMVERVFAIMLRAGAFAPPPPALSGADLEIEYVSPAVRSQRLGRARALGQFSEITGPMTQLDPTVHDNLDFDRAYRDTADVLGLPKDWLRGQAEVAAIRQQRQAAQAKAAQTQALTEGVDTAANAVRALPALRQAFEPSGMTEGANANA